MKDIKKNDCILNDNLINKIKSETGVTLILALFVMLICTTIAAVVLTSASVAGGRSSQFQEMDQRYYSVLSAANLLREELSGQEMTVEKIKEETVVYTTVSNKDENDVINTEQTKKDSAKYKFKISFADGTSFIIKDSVLNLSFGENEIPEEWDTWSDINDEKSENYYKYNNPSWNEVKRDLEMTHSFLDASVGDKNDLEVSIKSTLRADGKIYIDVTNKNKKIADKDFYNLRLIMNPTIKETVEESEPKTTINSTSDGDKITTIETIVTTTTKKRIFGWYQGDLRKI